MAEFDITVLSSTTMRETFTLEVPDGEDSPTFPELIARIKTGEFHNDVWQREMVARVVQIEDAQPTNYDMEDEEEA